MPTKPEILKRHTVARSRLFRADEERGALLMERLGPSMFRLGVAYPDRLPVLCDAAHIAGRRSLLYPVSQKAVDLGIDGLLFESHTNGAATMWRRTKPPTPAGK